MADTLMDSLPRPSVATSSRELSQTEIVRLIQRRDPAGIDKLYRNIIRGLRAYFGRRVGAADADDLAHETFYSVVQGLLRNGMVDPRCVNGYIRTISRRQLARHLSNRVESPVDIDLDEWVPSAAVSPETQALERERDRLIAEQLNAMKPRDREVLERFYLQGEDREHIQAVMGLTETQFRLIKSWAKALFAGRLRERLTAVGRRNP